MYCAIHWKAPKFTLLAVLFEWAKNRVGRIMSFEMLKIVFVCCAKENKRLIFLIFGFVFATVKICQNKAFSAEKVIDFSNFVALFAMLSGCHFSKQLKRAIFLVDFKQFFGWFQQKNCWFQTMFRLIWNYFFIDIFVTCYWLPM